MTHRLTLMSLLLPVLVILAMGCETDDFIIHDTDGCSSTTDDVELDEEPTTSSVIEAPLAEMTSLRPGKDPQ